MIDSRVDGKPLSLPDVLREAGSTDFSELAGGTSVCDKVGVDTKVASKSEVVEVSCFVKERENVCVQVQSENAVAVDVVMTVTTCPVTLWACVYSNGKISKVTSHQVP